MADERDKIKVGAADLEAMQLQDGMNAITATWGDEVPAPPHVDPVLLQDLVTITADANRSAGRVMGYGAALAWGISIGIHAERNRLERLSR